MFPTNSPKKNNTLKLQISFWQFGNKRLQEFALFYAHPVAQLEKNWPDFQNS
jgi:hypothetical protein